ncbi:neutral zinc metallopeptidase [Salsipaludibacter albus]|uniref:KPN_02809 family neutral zinc metallopeptidase n=1 Tax=Salsipaludibacter albus TaxID=2849650 RepID=UPI0023675A90|nr:neutral zinc metallopeptidase [Salsipaludibacter albus]MBY5164389.1 neutral zinc metallopeptidase [Salsipaludibacter albus]
MKIDPNYRSDNVTDRRGMGGTAMKVGGGLSIPVIIMVLLFTVFGGDSGDLGGVLNELGQPAPDAGGATGSAIDPANDPDSQELAIVSYVLDDSQALWADVFEASGMDYPTSQLVVYEGGTSTSGCGYGQSAAGPFYCPADSTTYIDLGFFELMEQRFGAEGDFAQAYVVAHEIGHHVQNALGLSSQVRQQQQANPSEANDLSVKLELQADCLAGVWANSADQEGELGITAADIDEAIAAAEAIGDDALQRQAGQNPNPESFTHGSSAQRVEWFTTGYETGDPNACDTFG